MAHNVRHLAEQLIGHRVRVFFDDEEAVGRIATITEELLILSVGDEDVLFVDVADITAIRVVGNGSSHDDDDEE